MINHYIFHCMTSLLDDIKFWRALLYVTFKFIHATEQNDETSSSCLTSRILELVFCFRFIDVACNIFYLNLF